MNPSVNRCQTGLLLPEDHSLNSETEDDAQIQKTVPSSCPEELTKSGQSTPGHHLRGLSFGLEEEDCGSCLVLVGGAEKTPSSLDTSEPQENHL